MFVISISRHIFYSAIACSRSLISISLNLTIYLSIYPSVSLLCFLSINWGGFYLMRLMDRLGDTRTHQPPSTIKGGKMEEANDKRVDRKNKKRSRRRRRRRLVDERKGGGRREAKKREKRETEAKNKRLKVGACLIGRSIISSIYK